MGKIKENVIDWNFYLEHAKPKMILTLILIFGMLERFSADFFIYNFFLFSFFFLFVFFFFGGVGGGGGGAKGEGEGGGNKKNYPRITTKYACIYGYW